MAQGTTWQQAVQWLPETQVVANTQLRLLVKHDTYGISFALEGNMASAASASSGMSSNLGDAPVEVPLMVRTVNCQTDHIYLRDAVWLWKGLTDLGEIKFICQRSMHP